MGLTEQALAHVTKLSSGGAIDPELRITLNFHPDRHGVLDGLASDGVYLSQFVTGTSNGGLGGERRRWESRIFGGAYDEAPARQRPVYGALNFRRREVGGAPRFGSAHLRLTAETLSRATFCYPDSYFEPEHFGVAHRMDLIAFADARECDVLDDYIEAQVHGPVRLAHDVEALVLDPSYQGTPVEVAARRLPCRVEWHEGFRLSVDELQRHPDYRGPQYVELGRRIAIDGVLTARAIGDAANHYDNQELKRVWHCVARFG
ncbi:DUF3626 domain-containing protein [Kribbella sp. NPDC051952]|uniref:DUF3626 domain-containing protein n=1 Tax=Kribbella sp. NPDC051952 TaxID=3154851 RepID=UPI00341DC0FF